MRKLRKTIAWKDVFFVLIIIKLVYWLLRCCGMKKRKEKVDRFDAKIFEDQLIVMRKDDVTDEQFERWKTKNLRARNIKFSKVCGNCDNSLELWEGANVSTFISGGGKVASGGNSSGASVIEGGGEDEVAFYSYNLVIDIPEPAPDECELEKYRIGDVKINPPDGGKEPAITVAVFDTGLMTEIKSVYTRPVPETCIPNGEKGWNFVAKNATTLDDNDMRHGSIVTKFIIDQAHKYKKQRINILPVKVHNSDGVSDLFSILCGFAYAANCGARIINASFGFYTKQKSDPPGLLAAFVKKHIQGNNILLVAAAGNANKEEDSDFLVHSTGNPRNLDQHSFYPACLAKDFAHVLAVTTVGVTNKKATVSPEENFSGTLVGLGVGCDVVDQKGNFTFRHPMNNNVLIYGSSYATPIVTGIIAQHYAELISTMPGKQFDKKLVVSALASRSLVHTDKRLTPFVAGGSFCIK